MWVAFDEQANVGVQTYKMQVLPCLGLVPWTDCGIRAAQSEEKTGKH